MTIAALALLACACESRVPRFDVADRPAADPVAVGEAPSGADGGSEALSEDKAAECGRGTGRNRDGNCVQIGLRDVGYVQRVQIPAGSFVMGYVPEQYDATRSQKQPAIRWPGQPPRIAESGGFWIDLHEVTRKAYETCVDAGPCSAAVCSSGEDPTADASPQLVEYLPQTCVTHDQASTFCKAHDGRLPTEVEWEYAARGSDARVYPWGNELRDDISSGLTPAGRLRADSSYFGILGMGTNAIEWVADSYEAESALAQFLSGSFRQSGGPLATARAALERTLACGDTPASGCRAPAGEPLRHVVKASTSGARRGVRATLPEHPATTGLEGWDETPTQVKLGFRCAADLDGARDEPLTLPTDPPTVPLLRDSGSVQIFGGVAEAVSRAEALQFCKRLRIPDADGARSDFRLPTVAEIQQGASDFRGPGPMWTADGAAAQRGEAPEPRPDDPWAAVDAEPGAALAARCVRTAG